MFYLASQILVFVAAALIIGALLTWVLLIGPVRRQSEAARHALAAAGTIADNGVACVDVGESETVVTVPTHSSEVASAALVNELSIRLRRQEDESALDKAELTARLATAEQQAARYERRVGAAELRMTAAERQVTAAGERVRMIEQALTQAQVQADRHDNRTAGVPAVVVPAARAALGAGGSARDVDTVGGSGGVIAVSGEAAAGQGEAVEALAAEAEQLRTQLAEAEGRAAKFSSRLAMARTEAEAAQRQVATMTTRLDRHQAEWAAEKVRLLARMSQTEQSVTAIDRGDAAIDRGDAGSDRGESEVNGQEVNADRANTGAQEDFGDDFDFDGRDPALAGVVPVQTARRVPGEYPGQRCAALPGSAAPAGLTSTPGDFPATASVEESGGRRDNLKEIVGIGPVVEARLQALGIASFRQLAELDDDGVDRLVRLLDGFGDRIVPDDWVGQARSLYERHYSGTA